MTIEEIDLYKMNADDLGKYLPSAGCASCGAQNSEELAKNILAGKCKAADCTSIGKELAGAMDHILSMDIHLPESDPMMQKVPEKLIEINSPDVDSPVVITGNSIITHRILKLIFETTGTKAFVIPVETIGYTLDNSIGSNAFTAMGVMRALTESGIVSKVSKRRMIIPGLASDQKSSIERITRWNVLVGPVSGFELPLFILQNRE